MSRDERVRVLVVDDSADMREMVRLMLEARGYDVTVASNGAEAASRLPHVDPHVVITDLRMPVMDGFDLCRAIREHPLCSEVPILVLTGAALDDERISDLACDRNTEVMGKRELSDVPQRLALLAQRCAPDGWSACRG
jgi:CheY-like chemotaxis protein